MTETTTLSALRPTAEPTLSSDLRNNVQPIEQKGLSKLESTSDRPAALARSIRVLSAYPDRRADLGSAARRTVATAHRWDQAIDHLREVYEGLVSNPAPLEAPHANANTEGP